MNQHQQNNTQAVQIKAQTKTLRTLIEGDGFKQQIAKLLPRHMTPERMARIAVLALGRTPKLALCTQASLFNALLTLSQLGLEPDGRNAHLIPFKNNKTGQYECQLVVDYKGLASLIQRSGCVSNIHADIVCENDEFIFDRGELKAHRIDFKKPRGSAYAAYSLVRFKDGSESCVVLGKDEIYAVRNKSSGWSAHLRFKVPSPWADAQSEPEMWKKTAFKRHSKWLPLSAEYRDHMEKIDEAEARAGEPQIDTPFDIDLEPSQIEGQTAAEQLPESEAAQGDAPEEKPEPTRELPQVKHNPTDPIGVTTLSPDQDVIKGTFESNDVTFEQFRFVAGVPNSDSWAGWYEVPAAVCQQLRSDAKRMIKVINLAKALPK